MPDWQIMSALLAGVPDLPGARCKGAADLYAQTLAEHGKLTTRTELGTARAAAMRICAACPALDPCRAWLVALPQSRRPRGIVAGQLITASGLPAKAQPPAEHVVLSRTNS